MTIKDVYEFYFNKYDVINIKTELVGGIHGKNHTFTREGYKNFLSNLDDSEVVEVIFQNAYTIRKDNSVQIMKTMDIPLLYILYK